MPGQTNRRISPGTMRSRFRCWPGSSPKTRSGLVVDSGCLHNFSGSRLWRYKKRLVEWLAPQGIFVLAGFGKRHPLDWRPVGPRRRSRDRIVQMFAPELRETAYEQELMRGVAFPIGPEVLGQSFRFEVAGNTETVRDERRDS